MKIKAFLALSAALAPVAAPAQDSQSFPGPPVAAEPERAAPIDIHSLGPAAVPLVLLPLDTGQTSDPIWATGDKPASNKIAAVTLRAVGGAVVEEDFGQGAGKPIVLPLAVAGDASGFVQLAHLKAQPGARYYCGAGSGRNAGKLLCFQDKDGDSRFESMALGLTEAGRNVEQLSILGKPTALPKPVAYRAARDEELPTFGATYVNCGKDHDRPRYSLQSQVKASSLTSADLAEMNARLGEKPNVAELRQMLSSLAQRGSAAPCLSGDRVEKGDVFYPEGVPEKGVAARLGELVIIVGPKDAGAPVRLVRLARPDRLYRIERGAVVPLSLAPTTKQNQLAIEQKFDKPVLMTAAGATAMEGDRAVGDVLLEVPFAHGYMGVLTEETKVRTLFSSRSLPKGTVLYGVPMSQRTVLTVNGIPRSSPDPGPVGPEDVRLVWCVPVEEEGKWSATCLPAQEDRYTILKGQSPAFEVRSLSYNAGTSTTTGAVPVAQQKADFGQPLRYRFLLKALTDTQILVTQETLFGDRVVHTRDRPVVRVKGGMSGLSVGTGAILLTDGADDGKIRVKKAGEFKPGVDARIESRLLSRKAPRPAPVV